MSAADTRARAAQARAFLAAATLHAGDVDPANANVSASNAVLAGIAASDAMCGHALKKCAQGENHADAVELLSTVSVSAARKLKSLLSAKTTSQYGASYVTPARAHDLCSQAQRLCDEMDTLLAR
jgi:hypothetical protein